MTKDEALDLVLDWLVCYKDKSMSRNNAEELAEELITAIKQARSAPVQEPVAFEDWHSANYVQPLEKYGDSYKNMHVRNRWQGWLGAKSTPPAAQRQWVGLTLADREKLRDQFEGWNYPAILVDAVADILKEKNT